MEKYTVSIDMESQYYKDDYFPPNWSIDSMQFQSKPKQVGWRTWPVDNKIYGRVKKPRTAKIFQTKIRWGDNQVFKVVVSNTVMLAGIEINQWNGSETDLWAHEVVVWQGSLWGKDGLFHKRC